MDLKDFQDVGVTIWKQCMTCKGERLIPVSGDYTACPSCVGKGRKQREVTLEEFAELLTCTSAFGKLMSHDERQ